MTTVPQEIRETWATPDDLPWNARLHRRRGGRGSRSSYEVDRDRIVHSETFRELQHKTQVQGIVNALAQAGVGFRTRLNHVIEVSQLARGLAREIGANEALSEAIALAHDLGHPPFGHAGERALRDALSDHGGLGWNANVHSLAVVDEVEVAFTGFRGLNLTWATREGIARHSTPFDEPESVGEFVKTNFGGLECQIVDASDVLAYITHDLDDALIGGFVDLSEVASSSTLLAELVDDAQRSWQESGQRTWPSDEQATTVRRRVVAKLINLMIADIVETSSRKRSTHHISSAEGVRNATERIVTHSETFEELVQDLLRLLMSRYYRSPAVRAADKRAASLLQSMFDELVTRPDLIPERFRSADTDPLDDAATFLASLNDRSAVALANSLGLYDVGSVIPKHSI